MIISASRRTDIPAFYAAWFMNRLREGEVLVRNPVNPHQVSRVPLGPEVADGIVFWSKNPAPLLPHLPEIARRYPFYVQYTVNAYGRGVEPGLPALQERVDTLRRIVDGHGCGRVVWRYDPVLLSPACPVEWHEEQFARLAEAFCGYTDECVFSFVDIYDKVRGRLGAMGVRAPDESEMRRLARSFARAAQGCGMTLRTCCEVVPDAPGILHGKCIDGERIARLSGRRLAVRGDAAQRPGCGCAESVDIGQYNTCRHACCYCYANLSPQSARANALRHLPTGEMLVGRADAADRITARRVRSHRRADDGQLSLPEDLFP